MEGWQSSFGVACGVALAVSVGACAASEAEPAPPVDQAGVGRRAGPVEPTESEPTESEPAESEPAEPDAEPIGPDPADAGSEQSTGGSPDESDEPSDRPPKPKRGTSPVVRPREPRAACREAGGRWRQFRNTCVDSCRKARSTEPVACGMALTMGCDCGPERCWNGATCVPNGTAPGPGEQPKPPSGPTPPAGPEPPRLR